LKSYFVRVFCSPFMHSGCDLSDVFFFGCCFSFLFVLVIRCSVKVHINIGITNVHLNIIQMLNYKFVRIDGLCFCATTTQLYHFISTTRIVVKYSCGLRDTINEVVCTEGDYNTTRDRGKVSLTEVSR